MPSILSNKLVMKMNTPNKAANVNLVHFSKSSKKQFVKKKRYPDRVTEETDSTVFTALISREKISEPVW